MRVLLIFPFRFPSLLLSIFRRGMRKKDTLLFVFNLGCFSMCTECLIVYEMNRIRVGTLVTDKSNFQHLGIETSLTNCFPPPPLLSSDGPRVIGFR